VHSKTFFFKPNDDNDDDDVMYAKVSLDTMTRRNAEVYKAEHKKI